MPVDEGYDAHPLLQEADDVLCRFADPRPVKESVAVGVGAQHAARVAGHEGRVLLGDSGARRLCCDGEGSGGESGGGTLLLGPPLGLSRASLNESQEP